MESIRLLLQNACIVTIWGYSAPDSDLDAKDVMLKAFSKTFRKLDQIEIVDIADKNILVKNGNHLSKKQTIT